MSCVRCLFVAALTLHVAVALAKLAGAATVAPLRVLDRVVADEIRTEATRFNRDPAGKPLPLAALWNTGPTADGFTPAVQLGMVREGHHLLPTFYLPTPADEDGDPTYYASIREARELRLPLTFKSTQWESLLLDNGRGADGSKTGLVVVCGPSECLSPFGPLPAWERVGARWGGTTMLKRIEDCYPDPPLIIFLSNNEAPKLRWIQLDEDPQYASRYGSGQGDESKRRIVSDAWAQRYRALGRGFRDALVAPAWSRTSIFVAFNAFGPSFLGRWPGWRQQALVTDGRMTSEADGWDGASVAFYVNGRDDSTDFTVFSPQIAAMNWVPMSAEIERSSPNFWLEMSTWDGAEPDGSHDKRVLYRKLGQRVGVERYRGMVQFGMWLLRPRVVREYRGYLEGRHGTAPYFGQVVRAVDRVYETQTLETFWRRGQLIANASHEHPYQADLTPSLAAGRRWFLLDTNLDPPRPWTLTTELKVFALALVKGGAGARQWLVYAHAPLGDQDGVAMIVPGFGTMTGTVRVGGSFFVADEKSGDAHELMPVEGADETRPNPQEPGRATPHAGGLAGH